MSSDRLEWRGREVVAKVMEAGRRAVDATTEDAARTAASRAPSGSSGALDSRPARVTGRRVAGEWGIYDHPAAQRAIDVELGNARWPGDPYLQPAQDQAYPQLARRIREALR